MDRITLFEELRLIERSENEVNGAWKGAHLLLFFLAFIFGSFCTFCFHILMYLFDEKCVLFPKLLSLTSVQHNVIYKFIPEEKDRSDMLPVDFLSTQWVEKSACYLPTFIPLVSGIFGLVWTTMFLMCSNGSRTLTGLQRPWRVVPPVFVFSLAMGGLCIYSSTMTHYGLQELCVKLGEITGSSTCSYTVNVATLVYERRIRGVYQATRLTIISAWLHTCCWLLSALLALVRILLAVDFQLVRVNVELQGDFDKMLEQREEQLRSVSPDLGLNIKSNSDLSILSSQSSNDIHFEKKDSVKSLTDDMAHLSGQSDILYFADELLPQQTSELSLVPEERNKLARLSAYESVPKENQFIVKILYDLLDVMDFPESPAESPPMSLSTSSSTIQTEVTKISRQYGQETISLKYPDSNVNEMPPFESVSKQEAEKVAKEIKQNLQERLYRQLIELPINPEDRAPSTSRKKGHITFESSMNITSEMKQHLEGRLNRRLDENSEKEDEEPRRTKKKVKKKSNLKNIGIQTGKDAKKQKVTISESRSTYNESEPTSSESLITIEKEDKDTQTHKEKQD